MLSVIALSGIYDFDIAIASNQNAQETISDMVVDSISYWKQAQPIENINQTTNTKFLIVHGTNDNIVGSSQPFTFLNSLNAKGYCTELSILQGRGHDLLKFINDPADSVRVKVERYLDSLLLENVCTTLTAINHEGLLNDQVDIYPNPSKGVLKINFENTFSGEVYILNINGQILKNVKVRNLNSYQIGTEKFASGVYFIKINSLLGNSTTKKIIMK